MIEDLIEFLRGIVDNPGRVIGPLWMLFWLWSVARGWINRFKQARERGAAPEPKPKPKLERPRKVARPAAAPRAAAQQVKPAPPRKAESRWPALIERAERLRAQLLHERALRWIEPIAVSEVIEPLRAAHARSRSADVETEIERTASGAVLTLQALEHVVRERTGDGGAAVLFELDRIAEAAHRPLAEYARAEDIALLGHTPLTVRFEAHREHYARGLTPRLLFLTAPRSAGAELRDYTAAVQALGRRWFYAFPSLPEQLRDELGLSDNARLVDPRYGFDERSAYASFGPWLPALFAELALTLRFGNAYVTALRREVLASGAAAMHGRARGEYLDPEPPPLLRLHAALVALRALGRHNDAERHLAAVAGALPGAGDTLLPLADGRAIALPTAFMARLTAELSETVLDARVPALGGVSLREWPGLAQATEDAREQASLSGELIRGTPRSKDAAQLLAAAWIVAEESEGPAAVLASLRAALAPRLDRAAHEAGSPAARRPRSLHAAFRDPRTLRNAIVLGAAFSTPRSARARR